MSVPQILTDPGQIAALRMRGSPQPDGLVRFIRLLRSNWKFIALAVVAVVVVVGAMLTQVPRQYAATATILLDTQRQTVVDVEAVLSGLNLDPVTVENQLQILQSREMAKAVMDRLQLWDDPEYQKSRGLLSRLNPLRWLTGTNVEFTAEEKVEAGISKFLAAVSVGVKGRSSALAVTFTSTHPEKSAKVANAIADEYVRGQVVAKINASEQATEWLSVQVQDLAKQVKTAEAAVADYEAAHNIIDVDNGATIINKQLIELSAQLATAQAARAQAEARFGQTGNGNAVTSVTESVLISQLRGEEAVVMRKVQDLTARYQEAHPDLVRARSELAVLRQKIADETARVVGALRSDYNAAQQAEHDLQAQITKLEATANSQRASTVELRQLQREANSVRTLYEAMLGRLKETQGTYSMQTPDARVLSFATPPVSASSPNTTLIMALVVPLATTFAVVVLVILERLSNSYASPSQLEEALDVPVIGMIPEINEPRLKSDIASDVVDNPISAFAEGIRSVESGLVLSNTDEPPRVVLVTSATPGEGKTVLAVGLARLMARRGHKVALLDLDLRNPTVLRNVCVAPRENILGLLEGTVDPASCIARDDRSDLHVFGATDRVPDAPELLTSARVVHLLDRLRADYDTVIIDAAPVLPVNDTKLIARFADAVVLAVRWGRAPRELVASALDQIRDASGNVAGVVLTRADQKRAMPFYDGYTYGSMKPAA